jgi:hypothetical protein
MVSDKSDQVVLSYSWTMSWPARHLSRFIARAPEVVCAFLADHRNLPKWAAGLSSGVYEENGAVISESPMGKVQVRFAPGGELGIFDHDVTLPDGQTFHNPLRVLKNEEGSEVVFTLYRHVGVTDEEYEKDTALITRDLERLASALEGEEANHARAESMA